MTGRRWQEYTGPIEITPEQVLESFLKGPERITCEKPRGLPPRKLSLMSSGTEPEYVPNYTRRRKIVEGEKVLDSGEDTP